MIKTGDRCIWKPQEITAEGQYKCMKDHPWYESTVKVLEVEKQGFRTIYKVKPINAPTVNNQRSFQFWADEYELEKVK